jgi:hypothetical protein
MLKFEHRKGRMNFAHLHLAEEFLEDILFLNDLSEEA